MPGILQHTQAEKPAPLVFADCGGDVRWGRHFISDQTIERLMILLWDERLKARAEGDETILAGVESLIDQLRTADLRAKQWRRAASVHHREKVA